MLKISTLTVLFLYASFACLLAQQPCGNPPEQVPPAESCAEACIYCSFNGYNGSTANYDASGASACFDLENDQWLAFYAATGTATFTVTPSNCANGNGVQVALYDDCGGSLIACNPGGAGQGTTPCVITANMTPGNVYFLMIDGYNGDACNFNINVNPPQGNAQKLGATLPIQGVSNTCPGATVQMQVPAVTNAAKYKWTGPSGVLFNGESSPAEFDAPAGRTVLVTFAASNGVQQICVQAKNNCEQGPVVCKNVQVSALPPTIYPAITLCYEDIPYELPWGDVVKTVGTQTYQTTLTSYLGCDSVIMQKVTVLSPKVSNLGFKYVCKGGSINVCGETFSENGLFQVVCQSFQGCDSLINGLLTVLDPTAKIIAKGGGIACSGIKDTVTLKSAPSMPGTLKSWSRNGVVVGTGDSIKVTQPGVYVLVAKITLAGKSCTATDTSNVILGTSGQPPVLQTTVIKSISCINKEAELGVSSNPPALSYSWSGPGLTNATGPTIKTTEFGEYSVTVVDINGCTNTAKINVPADTVKPQVLSITKSPLGGIGAIKGRLITKVNIPNAKFSWEGPNLFTNTFQNPLVYGFGTYTVTVTNPANGCTTTATFEFTDKNKPGINEPTEKEAAVKSAAQIHEWHLFPNPGTGLVNIAYKGAHLPENVQFKAYDSLGKLVYQSASNGSFIQNISLQNATPGLYVLEITQTGDEATVPERLRFVVK